MGAPGKVVRPVAQKDLDRMRQGCDAYRWKAREYAARLVLRQS
jgi:hypothetical protein